ncbi:UNVERIFIED_ORG: alkanesulfonate monooxygenase SsuD/methylene tetrahydromethanopterin reductase-like flavin-dependent oxidoreductase (luciferase family) [Nocardia globerula]|uniref:Alkanesulfonate monooxygenase SsuD/methylene tetrahydromethanopterin reductase-like flavin-dependent oxidoreductase (Luciferase family) n=1 Tax=Nocardia globerula TaxID=1818 RepID=A0A652YSH9_NOCGL|nr:LLM class flavin-dependent oxidoreductase [Rhodococcus globerulus]NMD61411.1 LLM class flavin-dependent oxidoreductase [Nocardia globerula]PVX67039.1 alkanesulfonate monooxygenase SsuD/methylene tetrahydromethanopterin reductase-like flavin-dependent oxidoreductase (luciferase family) [Rhodococcus globerulus]
MNDSIPGPQFGLYVPQLKMDAASVIAVAQQAEEHQFDSFWIMDHLYAPGAPGCDSLESWTLLSAIAGATSRIRLGHLVGCNPFRHPSLLAKMAATVDQISGGRLDLGLGWGSVEDELTTFGFPFGSRRERSDALGETLEILELMFTGEPFNYSGKHFELRGAFGLPRPVAGRIPIHIGGGGRQLTMPLVARHADWWNCVGSARHRLEDLAPLRGSARISAQYAVGLARTTADIDEVAAKTARRMPEAGWGKALVGTPDQLVDLFLDEQARGIDLFVLRFHDFANAETMRIFATEVAPNVRAHRVAQTGS